MQLTLHSQKTIQQPGEVGEWLKPTACSTVVGVILPRVRISSSPQIFRTIDRRDGRVVDCGGLENR